MPNKVTSVATAGEVHPLPFVGPSDHPVAIRVDVSALTATLVDAYGYLKPGVLLMRNGLPIGVGGAAHGAVAEAVKVAANNGADLATAPDIDVTVFTECAINRAILEDSLGRVLSADELASVGVAGHSPITLLY